MVWDLRGALLKKGEHESARLDRFEFLLRARAFRSLASAMGAEPDGVVALIARTDDTGALEELATRYPDLADKLPAMLDEARSTARIDLIKEVGDPTPHRLL